MNKEKRLANFALTVFAGLSIIFLILPVSSLVHSIRVFLTYGLYPTLNYGEALEYYVRGVPKNFVRLLRTDQENLMLKSQIKEVQIIKAKTEAVMEENRRLRSIINTRQDFEWKGVWARIIERAPSHWHNSFLIDLGAADNIKINSAVLGIHNGKTGLVGRVSDVTAHVSKVLLITDGVSSTICYVRGREEWEGLAEGQGRETLKLNYMPSEADIKIGMELFTSPSSKILPAGILIGTVSKVYQKESFVTFLSAEITLAAPPDALREVFVLTAPLSDIDPKAPLSFQEQEKT